MAKRILITGGAGFIGSHLGDELLRRGHTVRALDNLASQVDGSNRQRPDYLNPEIELQIGDLRDGRVLQRALVGIDVVFHLAAKVGVGQSMYEIAEFTSVNNQGTAQLLESLIQHPVERLIVASSMSIYGEGMYMNREGQFVPGVERNLLQLRNHHWELQDAAGETLAPVPTPEKKPPALASIYALSKFDQERMCLLAGRAYRIPTVALRFFNVYGTRQSLSNPYTGVLANFASRLLNGKAPMIFEDGQQQRDFVSVRDVAQACRLALEAPEVTGRVFNVGSGSCFTVREIADRMSRALGREQIQPEITNKYRVGDIRHCFADISLARQLLGYEPRVELEEGLAELADWLQGQLAIDQVGDASAVLTQ